MIHFQKYYQKYLEYYKNEKIFGRYDPELEGVSEYIKTKGFLSKNDLREIARWKSPRRANDVLKNKKDEVKNITEIVFKSTNPESKIKDLDNLKGIGIPIASAILCMQNPRDYGVIDIRVWSALNKIDDSFGKKIYSYFTIKDYNKYLVKIRSLAQQNRMTCRQIDMALWAFDKEQKKHKKPCRIWKKLI